MARDTREIAKTPQPGDVAYDGERGITRHVVEVLKNNVYYQAGAGKKAKSCLIATWQAWVLKNNTTVNGPK